MYYLIKYGYDGKNFAAFREIMGKIAWKTP